LAGAELNFRSGIPFPLTINVNACRVGGAIVDMGLNGRTDGEAVLTVAQQDLIWAAMPLPLDRVRVAIAIEISPNEAKG
jgi:hypothetical protein